MIDGYKRARRQDAEKWIKPIQESTTEGIKSPIAILDDEKNSKVETIVQFIEKNNIDFPKNVSWVLEDYPNLNKC